MSNLADKYIGKYVIVRTWASGVHFGILKEFGAQNRQCLLENCRRIWKWEGAFTLTEVSENGIRDGKLSIVKPEILICQIEEFIPCSIEAENQLRAFPAYLTE